MSRADTFEQKYKQLLKEHEKAQSEWVNKEREYQQQIQVLSSFVEEQSLQKSFTEYCNQQSQQMQNSGFFDTQSINQTLTRPIRISQPFHDGFLGVETNTEVGRQSNISLQFRSSNVSSHVPKDSKSSGELFDDVMPDDLGETNGNTSIISLESALAKNNRTTRQSKSPSGKPIVVQPKKASHLTTELSAIPSDQIPNESLFRLSTTPQKYESSQPGLRSPREFGSIREFPDKSKSQIGYFKPASDRKEHKSPSVFQSNLPRQESATFQSVDSQPQRPKSKSFFDAIKTGQLPFKQVKEEPGSGEVGEDDKKSQEGDFKGMLKSITNSLFSGLKSPSKQQQQQQAAPKVESFAIKVDRADRPKTSTQLATNDPGSARFGVEIGTSHKQPNRQLSYHSQDLVRNEEVTPFTPEALFENTKKFKVGGKIQSTIVQGAHDEGDENVRESIIVHSNRVHTSNKGENEPIFMPIGPDQAQSRDRVLSKQNSAPAARSAPATFHSRPNPQPSENKKEPEVAVGEVDMEQLFERNIRGLVPVTEENPHAVDNYSEVQSRNSFDEYLEDPENGSNSFNQASKYFSNSDVIDSSRNNRRSAISYASSMRGEQRETGLPRNMSEIQGQAEKKVIFQEEQEAKSQGVLAPNDFDDDIGHPTTRSGTLKLKSSSRLFVRYDQSKMDRLQNSVIGHKYFKNNSVADRRRNKFSGRPSKFGGGREQHRLDSIPSTESLSRGINTVQTSRLEQPLEDEDCSSDIGSLKVEAPIFDDKFSRMRTTGQNQRGSMVSTKTITADEELAYPRQAIDGIDHSKISLALHSKSKSGVTPMKRVAPKQVTKGTEFQSNPKYRENIDDFIEDLTNSQNTIEKSNQLNQTQPISSSLKSKMATPIKSASSTPYKSRNGLPTAQSIGDPKLLKLNSIDEVVYQENDDDIKSEDIDEGHPQKFSDLEKQMPTMYSLKKMQLNPDQLPNLTLDFLRFPRYKSDHIYEQFQVIGLADQILEVLGPEEEDGLANIPAECLYKFPETPICKKVEEKSHVIQDFVFPEGLKVQRIKNLMDEKVKTVLNNMTFQIQGNRKNAFILTLDSYSGDKQEDEMMSRASTVNFQAAAEVSPNEIGIDNHFNCLSIKFRRVQKRKSDGALFLVDAAFSFFCRNSFFPLLFEILDKMLQQVQQNYRLNQMFFQQNSQGLSHITRDGPEERRRLIENTFLKFDFLDGSNYESIQQMINVELDFSTKSTDPQEKYQGVYPLGQEVKMPLALKQFEGFQEVFELTYQFPRTVRECHRFSGQWNLPVLLSIPLFDDLRVVLKIVTSIFLEKQIVIVSSDVAKLSSVLLAFKYLVRPFDINFTIITSLPNALIENVLFSPFPMLVGISHDQYELLKDFDEFHSQDYVESITWIFLDASTTQPEVPSQRGRMSDQFICRQPVCGGIDWCCGENDAVKMSEYLWFREYTQLPLLNQIHKEFMASKTSDNQEDLTNDCEDEIVYQPTDLQQSIIARFCDRYDEMISSQILMNINMDKILKENNRISQRENNEIEQFTSAVSFCILTHSIKKMERFKYITKGECQIRQQYEQRRSMQTQLTTRRIGGPEDSKYHSFHEQTMLKPRTSDGLPPMNATFATAGSNPITEEGSLPPSRKPSGMIGRESMLGNNKLDCCYDFMKSFVETQAFQSLVQDMFERAILKTAQGNTTFRSETTWR